MPPEARVIVVVAGIALLTAGWITYWFVRHDVPGYGIAMAWAIVAFCAMVSIQAALPRAEERMARALSRSHASVPIAATVKRVDRRSVREGQAVHATCLGLTLDVAQAPTGMPRPLYLEVDIEDAFLAQFAHGSVVHLLYDPHNPSRVAIDRGRSPTMLH